VLFRSLLLEELAKLKKEAVGAKPVLALPFPQ
jgi:hypothetical protein